MTLTSHAIVGAAIASFLPQDPVLAFALAFTSHFVIDAIPHWDYAIKSKSIDPDYGAPMKYDRALLQDFFRIGSDAFLGVILALVIFASPSNLFVVSLGIIGAMLPDVFQFLYMRRKIEPLILFQCLHRWVSQGSKYLEMDNRPVVGIISQFLFLVIVVCFAKFV